MLETVKAYRGAGLTLTPIDGKRPFLPEWPTAEYTDEQWNTWASPVSKYGIGLVLGKRSHNIICIDIDPRDQGLLWLKKHPDILESAGVIEESGRCDGGKHLFFLDSEQRYQRKCKLDKGVDFLTTGSQVVLAPSIHPETGKPYTKTKGDLSLFAFSLNELPEWVHQELEQKNVTKLRETQKPLVVDTDRDISEDDRRILLDHLSSLDSSRGRHNMIGSWITNAYGAGMTEEEITEHAEGWINSQGRAPQTNEISNWIRHAEKTLALGESYISDNRLAPERFIANDENDTGFTPVKDPIPEDYIRNEVDDKLKWKKDKQLYMTLANVQKIIELHPVFKGKLAYNEMTYTPIKYLHEKDSANLPWDSPAEKYTDNSTFAFTDFYALAHWFSAHPKYQLEVSDNISKKAVTNVARQKMIHPVRDWLLGLQWDGEKRLKTWLSFVTGCKVSAYTDAMSEFIILAIVARIIKPGTKWDNCIILEGRQGNGKSTLCQLIAGGEDYFCDTPGDLKDAKVNMERTRGTLVVELGEIDKYLKSYNSSILKSWLSTRVDKARLAYAQDAVQLPRSFIVLGTTNFNSDYLRDSTGERRYFPIETGKDFFKLDWFKNNRDQIFAEAAKVIADRGIDRALLIPNDITEQQKLFQQDRCEEDNWRADIEAFLLEKRREFYRPADILFEVFQILHSKQKRADLMRVKNILDQLGFTPTRFKTKMGQMIRGFKPGSTTPDSFFPLE